MSLTIQLSKGFIVENCSDCGSYFWISSDTAHRVTASGNTLKCRDCQIAKGWDIPAWPCARRLSDAEIDEMELEKARDIALLSPPPAEMAYDPSTCTLSLAELREKLKYYPHVTQTKQVAFARASGVNEMTISQFCRGKGVLTKNRHKIVSEMHVRGWLTEATEEKPVEPAIAPVIREGNSLTKQQKRLLTALIHFADISDEQKDDLYSALDL